MQIYRGNNFSSENTQDNVHYNSKHLDRKNLAPLHKTINTLSGRSSLPPSGLSSDKRRSRYIRSGSGRSVARQGSQIGQKRSFSGAHRMIQSSRKRSGPFDTQRSGRADSSTQEHTESGDTNQPCIQHCHLCGTVKTGQWRRGPAGPRTLCNACGLDWSKKLKLEASKRGSDVPPLAIENAIAEGWWKTSARRRNQAKTASTHRDKSQTYSVDLDLDNLTPKSDSKQSSPQPSSPRDSISPLKSSPSSADSDHHTADDLQASPSSPDNHTHTQSITSPPAEDNPPEKRPPIKLLFPASRRPSSVSKDGGS